MILSWFWKYCQERIRYDQKIKSYFSTIKQIRFLMLKAPLENGLMANVDLVHPAYSVLNDAQLSTKYLMQLVRVSVFLKKKLKCKTSTNPFLTFHTWLCDKEVSHRHVGQINKNGPICSVRPHCDILSLIHKIYWNIYQLHFNWNHLPR